MKESIKASVENEQLTAGAKRLLVDAGSNDRGVAMAAQAKIADGVTEALRNPVEAEIREGIMDGDIVSDIYRKRVINRSASALGTASQRQAASFAPVPDMSGKATSSE